MTVKRFVKFPVVIIPLCLVVFGFLVMQSVPVLLNGEVCNHSSNRIWLTVTESGRKKAYALPPGQCTDAFTQDAEAIWGRDCNTEPCQVRAWKVSAGHFYIENNSDSYSDAALQIKGWGVGSRWHIASNWPEPDLSTINYTLVR